MSAPTGAIFTIVDYIVLGASFFISAMIGVYFVFAEKNDKSRRNYFLGNRKMGVVPVSLSYSATAMSAVIFIGVPAEVYLFGPNTLLFVPGRMLGLLIVANSAVVIYYRLGVTSIYEYLEMRFDRTVKIASIVIFYVYAIAQTGFGVYAPALALSLITGMSVVSSILIVTFVCIVYTTIGGMKAVIWTDVFQAFLMTAGLLAIVIGTLVQVHGFDEMAKFVTEGGRVPYLDFTPDLKVRYTIYALTCNGVFGAISFITTNQAMVQRCLSCRTLRQAQIVIVLGFTFAVSIFCLAIISGMLVYTYYANCDPLTTGRIQRADQIVPLIIGDLFMEYPGVAGLIVSGAFSASLSTISSNLNGMAAIFEAAVLSRVFKKASDRRLTFFSKLVTVTFGVLCTVVALLATKLSGVLEETIALSSITICPLSAIFFMGFFVPRGNSKGALSGLIAGVVFGFWIKISSEIYPLSGPRPVLSVEGCPAEEGSVNVTSYGVYSTSTPGYFIDSTTMSSSPYPPTSIVDGFQEPSGMVDFYNMSVYFYSAFTIAVAFGVGVIVSLVTNNGTTVDDPRLRVSPLDVFCCRAKDATSGDQRYTVVATRDQYAGLESFNMQEKKRLPNHC